MSRCLLALLLLSLVLAVGARPSYLRVDRHALAAPASVERSVDDLARYLERGASTPEDKARAIFRWITDRIAYDSQAFLAGHAPQDYQSALATRKAVCAGYAALYLALAERMGLKAERIVGVSKGYGFDADSPGAKNQSHAWVAVQLAGRWGLIDPTWGAGALGRDGKFEKKFNERWFLVPPDEAIYDHFPDDPRWQLLSAPWSKDRFLDNIRVTGYFFQYGLQPISHKQVAVRCSGETTLKFRGPPSLRLIANLIGDNTEGHWTLCSHGGSESSVQVRCPQPGRYRLRIYGRLSDGQPTQGRKDYDWLAEYRLESVGRRHSCGYPLSYGAYMERGARLERPVQGVLPAQQKSDFRLTVPGARDVKLSWSGGEQSLQRGEADKFEGSCSPPPGKLVVYALFAGETRYWGLLEYEVH